MALLLRTRYTLNVPKGTISSAGIDALRSLMVRVRLDLNEEWKALNPDNQRPFLPELPGDWQWIWLVEGRGNYIGTFTKRLAKYFFKEWKIKCPESFISEIGNIARRHTEESLTYSFDFTDRFNWNDGDFNDKGSCFWGSNWDARDVMESNGMLAIRFYEGNDENSKGIARAWLYTIGESLYIIWNGYGLDTLVIARTFALFVNASYKRIELSNNGSTSGLIYVNSDRGYIVGSTAEIEAYDDYDFEFETYEESCENCGRHLMEDDVYFTPDGNHYCERCYDEHCGNCDRCYESYYRVNLVYVESTEQDVCPYCLNQEFSLCDNCQEYFKRDLLIAHNEETYCPDCFEELPPDEPDENEETDSEG